MPISVEDLTMAPQVWSVEQLVAAPPGWFAVYRQRDVLSLVPIVAWALTETAIDEATHAQAIRYFVMMPTGRIVDYEEPPFQLVCVAAPGQDAIKTAEAVLAADGISSDAAA